MPMHRFGLHTGEVRRSAFSLLMAFLLLSATLACAVWWVVHSAQTMSQVTRTEQQVNRQRHATDRLLKQLLLAGTQAEAATMHYADDRETSLYLQASEGVDSALMKLKRSLDDSLQRRRVDTLQSLVWLRRDATLALVSALRRENRSGADLQKQISHLHDRRHPVHVQMPTPVVQQDRQVVIERRKKGFFRRLADAFRRSKDDTLSMQLTQTEAATDTAVAQVDIADTLAQYLARVHQGWQRDSLTHASHLHLSSSRLRRASAELSQRMALLLDDFTSRQQRALGSKLQGERDRRTQAAWTLGLTAACTIVLAGVLLVLLQRDIRRSNRYRKALEEEKKQTERLMKRREQLLLTISHDIKAPVSSILGYIQMMPHEAFRRYEELTSMDRSAHRLLQLVTSLLDYHKLESGQADLKMQPTCVGQLLQESADGFRPLVQKKGLALVLDNEVPMSLWVNTDASRFRQIVDNLLSNAVKYTQQGCVRLKSSWQAEQQDLTISVVDTGCGMKPADLDRIFTPFTRVEGSEGQEGSGLGLSIIVELVKLLGGKMEVESKLGSGSRFTVSFPCQPCCKPAENADVPEMDAADPDIREVALVDDDLLQLQLSEAMLKNVLPAETTIAAFTRPDDLIRWLDEGHGPQLILTDIEMPSLSGFELLPVLHRHLGGTAVRIVAMTSHSMLPSSHFKERGFDDVLFKPFTQNDLRRIVPPASGRDAEPVHEVQRAGKRPFAALLAFAEGDKEAERSILQQFGKDCQTHHRVLLQTISTKDKAGLCGVAHKMLPTFTLLDSDVVPVLKQLDSQRADTVWTAECESAARSMMEELGRVLQELRAEDDAAGICGK